MDLGGVATVNMRARVCAALHERCADGLRLRGGGACCSSAALTAGSACLGGSSNNLAQSTYALARRLCSAFSMAKAP